MRTRRSPKNQRRLYNQIGRELEKAAGRTGTVPVPSTYQYAPTLYDECVKRGIPVQSHASDLYIPCTEETRALLLHYGHHRRGNKATPEVFINQVEGGRWYDVPFGYAPFWRDVAAKADAHAKGGK